MMSQKYRTSHTRYPRLTPESEWDLIQEVQFKGIDLNPLYDEKWVRRINYEIELHVDSGF